MAIVSLLFQSVGLFLFVLSLSLFKTAKYKKELAYFAIAGISLVLIGGVLPS